MLSTCKPKTEEKKKKIIFVTKRFVEKQIKYMEMKRDSIFRPVYIRTAVCGNQPNEVQKVFRDTYFPGDTKKFVCFCCLRTLNGYEILTLYLSRKTIRRSH